MNKPKPKPQLVMLVIGASLAAAIGVFTLVQNRSKNSNNHSAIPCSDETFMSTFSDQRLFLSDNIDELGDFADQIKTYDNYQSSPNCMYVLTLYAINTGNKDEAKTHYDALTKAYEANGGYARGLRGHNMFSLERLGEAVEFLNGEKTNTATFEWSGQPPE